VLTYVCVILIDFQAHRDAFIQNHSETSNKFTVENQIQILIFFFPYGSVSRSGFYCSSFRSNIVDALVVPIQSTVFIPPYVSVLQIGPPSFISNEYRVSLSGVTRPGSQVDYSPPSKAEVKNGWRYTSTPLCAFKA